MTNRNYAFREGEILLVDKPLHWTSFDVVNKIRWALSKKYGIKRFKVGHAGTLDPLATGLLVICSGKSTKLSESLTAKDKTYTGTFLLGKTTPSYDLETDFDATYDVEHITEEAIYKTGESFIGTQLQVPPIFSAKKINGKRAYKIARKGEDIELNANEIVIKEFVIESIRFPEVDFRIKCSKGTYIRSIANDFGKALQSGATLQSLRRTNSGDFDVADAKSVEEWIEIIQRQPIAQESLK